MDWNLYERQPSGWWVFVPAAGCVVGHVQRHVVTPVERHSWSAARPKGGDWLGFLDGALGAPAVARTRDEAAQAIYDEWVANPDRNASEVPAP